MAHASACRGELQFGAHYVTARVPSGVAAAMEALQFGRDTLPVPGALLQHSHEVLDFCDRAHLTLVLGAVAGDALPDWMRERIARNLAANAKWLERYRTLQSQVETWLETAGIDFIFLKGTTLWPHFVSDLRLRMQFDLDLLCPPEDAPRAWDLLIRQGYQPLETAELPTDHLPTLFRKTGFEWRGDHFDPESPISIEVHFRFWDGRTERIRAPGVDEFWKRRTRRALDTADALAYAALHLLRHIFRGSVSPHHVYELAWFLEHHAADQAFWDRWQTLHPPALRQLEAVAFRLAREWFGCSQGPVAEQETARLPAPVQDWFATFAASPLEGLFRPNKDELWLHLALLDSARDKMAVLRRRLVPLQLPGPADAVSIPDEQLTFRRRVLKQVRYLRYCASRVVYHTRAFPSVLRSGLRWRMRSSGLSKGYWTFLSASSLMSLGMFIYVLLYNLYLLDLGFREDFVGQVSGASTAGSVAAALPAAVLARRFGLDKMILWSFAAVGAISVLRALVSTRVPLLGLAFLNGISMSVFAVALAPAIARLTSEKARATGFSISTSSSIALGILGSWLGGRLSLWLGGKRPAMLVGCALVGLALWPAARLKILPAPAEGAKLYPRNRFVVRFLIVFALWNLANGLFNPFANTYFARMHVPVERIGMIFSGGQLAQVVALMLAPLVLRRLGMVSGTAAMLMATAAMLGTLATGPAAGAAAFLFAAYMAFQYMTDPGINTLLMDRVREQERGGAVALMMLVSFGAQFVSSLVGGGSIARFGYSKVLACAAGLAAVAAVAFRWLPGPEAAPDVSPVAPALLHASAPGSAPD
ncbi:MAG: MFS transporter [Bryobacteraceae bacterium]